MQCEYVRCFDRAAEALQPLLFGDEALEEIADGGVGMGVAAR